jgi:AbrB family looped-hinge helix DNA binding protein
MASPSGVRVRIDRQGRMVIPAALRDEISTTPGDVIVQRTAAGLLITAAPQEADVATAADGLPVLELDRVVSNTDVLDAIDHERSSR